MPDGDGLPIVTALDLVGVEIFGQLPYRRTSERLFHGTDAGVAEKSQDASMPVIPLLTKLVEPLVDERRDAALLGAHCCVSV
jgi:hypothetical protein